MSKGIIGTKLGMTQLFDQESGVVTPVTVIEAGPCPVVAVRTPETDGYGAVQLAFGEVKERKLSKPEVGHLKHAGVAPHRHLVEFRDAEGLSVGDTVTVESFQPGEAVKVSGRSKGKGFAGTIKRHNFASGPKSHGSHNVRAPGLDRRLGHAVARVQGHADGGPHGRPARHAARPDGGRGGRRAQPAADRGRRARARSAASSRSGADG